MRERLLSTREVSHILSISEKEIINLANANLVPHYKVAGEFLRFRKEDILKVKPAIKKKYNLPEHDHHTLEKMKEFFYFNDFYIISTIIIVLLMWVIVKDIAFGS